MALSIKNIFGKKDTQAVPGTDIVGTTQIGDIVISKNIEWKKEGVNDAGTAKGDTNAFRAGFGSCFQRVKKSQELDQALQDKMHTQIINEKIALEGQLNSEKGKMNMAQAELEANKNAVAEKQQEIAKVKSGIVNKEKTVRLEFMIGVGIIALLTIYLFIFYSSTAYSAFFRNFDVSDNVQEAMFDGNAIIDAFKSSFFTGCFILFMPVIFLGLGFVAHGFSTTAKGIEKYMKTILLYLLTFAFDFLLAYKISKAFYDIEAAMSLTPMTQFSIKLAFADMDFWIVIFCGFVSYVIWGLVFDFTMDRYDRLTNNKYELDALRDELTKAQGELTKIQNELSQHQQTIESLEVKIKQKTKELDIKVRYDFAIIRQSLADYHFGWTSYYGLTGQSTQTLKDVYDQEMKSVESWMNNKDGQ